MVADPPQDQLGSAELALGSGERGQSAPDEVEALLKQHGKSVRRNIERELPQRWASLLSADDVMQETYLDAFVDFASFDNRGEGSFEAWLGRIARNNMLNAIQSLEAARRGGPNRQRVEPADPERSFADLYDAVIAETRSPSRVVARQEACAAAKAAVDRLNATDRQLIEWHYLQGLPIKEVATRLGVREGKLHMKRARAVRMLGRLLGPAENFLTRGG